MVLCIAEYGWIWLGTIEVMAGRLEWLGCWMVKGWWVEVERLTVVGDPAIPSHPYPHPSPAISPSPSIQQSWAHSSTLVSHVSLMDRVLYASLVSHFLISQFGCFGPLWTTWFYARLPLVCHLFPTLRLWAAWFYACLRLISHVSFTYFPLWVLWAAWFYACLPPAYLSPIVSNYFGCFAPKNATLVSHSGWSGCSGPRDFTLFSPPVFHLCTICLARWVPWDAWFYACLLLVSCLSLACLALCLNMFSHWKILPTLIYCRDWRFDWRLI